MLQCSRPHQYSQCFDFFMGLLYGTHMGPIWATHIWANPYGTHAETGCTPHMGSPYGTHIGMFAGKKKKKRMCCPIRRRFDLGTFGLKHFVHLNAVRVVYRGIQFVNPVCTFFFNWGKWRRTHCKFSTKFPLILECFLRNYELLSAWNGAGSFGNKTTRRQNNTWTHFWDNSSTRRLLV